MLPRPTKGETNAILQFWNRGIAHSSPFASLRCVRAGQTTGRVGWALGSRDEPGPPTGKFGARLDRAWRNYLETFPIFAALVLRANGLGRHSQTLTLGAELYFYGRLVYLPVYALGIPILRTLVWAASFVGIVFILLGIWPGN